MSERRFSVIGKPLRKVDALAKCMGETRYADDLDFPRMIYAKILHSPHAHARIREVRTERAAAMEGVYAVITGADLPEKFGIMPSTQDEEALATEKARYVGDPVAAVAAASEALAEKALGLIEVDYEVLEPILTIEEALASTDPGEKIHSWNRRANIHKAASFEFGDIAEGFRRADLVFEDTFFYQGNTHLPMEQYCAVATCTPEGKLTVWSSTQTPHYLHRALSKVLGLPMSRIRVIAAPVGGGFGGKSDPFSHEMCVARLSMMTGRPVKITLTREESFYVHRGRHPVKMWIRTGVKNDGTLQAMHFRSFLDGGGYSSYGLATVYYTGALQTTTYRLPAYKFEGVRVFTNKPPCGPKRGHGTPQPRFALEIHLDKIAEKLGIDPIELRLRQLIEPGSVTVNGLRIGTSGLRECIEKVAERAEWKRKFRKLPYGRGIGFAASGYISGAGLPIYWNEMPHSGVQIRLDRGGGITVFCGSTDIGQGSDSILAYAVAEEFGVDPAHIRVVTADTDLTPVDLGSYSSRVTVMTGNAAIQACGKLKKLLLEAASEALEVPADDLEMVEGQVRSRSYPKRSLGFAECVEKAEARFGTLGATGSYRPPGHPGDYKGAGVGPSPAYSYSAAVVELSCDPETAQIKVEKVWIGHDCGRAFNPLLVEGQAEGSVYMALGEALMEEQVFRKTGLHKFPSMLDYKSLTTLEMPEIETILVETDDPEGPFGAKEAGQGFLLPVVPAVANALYDAIAVRIDEIPITPDKVLRALEGRLKPVSVPAFEFPPPIKWRPGEGVAVAQKS
ncbi:MAG TPA: molybdopterin cofactor-binding domain-containing protein [candidate division Zixibacteria bacterium]|nr:molybdopterin cofactor-binding domain-containing protein [candidate division Zixibacteria bacterium]